jgi:hypothetical protein
MQPLPEYTKFLHGFFALCMSLDGVEFIVCIIIREWDITKEMPPFSSGNIISITMKFRWMFHISFAIMRLLFDKVSIVFNALLPTLSKTPYSSVVKFLDSTLKLFTKTSFLFFVTCKMASA